MDLFSFIECANRTRSLKALFDLLVSCASQEGFTEVAYGALTYAEPVRLPEYQPPAIAVNFPASWCERYFERKYYEIDPVVRRTPTLLRPFMWDQLADQCQLQPGEQLVLNESREAGLKHGVSVPLFGPLGRVSVVSFASRHDDAEPLHRMSHLNALAWQFHIAFTEIAGPEENSQGRVRPIEAGKRLSAVDRRGQIVLGHRDDTEHQREHGQLSYQERDAKARNNEPHGSGREGYSSKPDRTSGTAGFTDAYLNMECWCFRTRRIMYPRGSCKCRSRASREPKEAVRQHWH